MFGKIIAGLIISDSYLFSDLAEILVFAGCLYLNNYLYRKLVFNLSLKDAASKAIKTGVTIWKTAKTVAAAAGA